MKKTRCSFVLSLVMGSLAACSAEDSSTPSSVGSAGTGMTSAAPGAGTGGGSGSSGAPSSIGTGAAGMSSMPMACPRLRPVEDSACTVHSELCTYDEIECRCPAGKWACVEPVDPNCPSMMPAHGAPCTVPEGTECEFLQDECECTAGRWTCESFEDAGTAPPTTTPPPVDAGVPMAGTGGQMPTAGSGGVMAVPCPDLRPIEGFSCTVSPRGCTYDTTHCVCPMGTWLCQESVDPACPPEPPMHGAPCTGRADCDFFEWECECLRNAWSCKAND